MSELDFETDAFLVLLTDALRAGPGSPPWHEALQRLRAGGIDDANEHRLLVAAREHLESGRSYRSIRAGAGFTQRLMATIDRESAPKRRAPVSATMVALISAGIVLITLLATGYLLWTAAEDPATAGGGSGLLVNTVASADFSGPLPPDWRMIGRLPIAFSRGAMRQGTAADPSASGGGIVWSQAIAADEPFAVAASVRVHRPEPNLIAQVFVTDAPHFSEDNATTSHELVWLLQADRSQVVLPSGRVEAQQDLGNGARRGSITVRITIDRHQATIEQGGKQLWSGPHGFDPGKPRHVGLRFLRGADDAGDGIVFQNVRINMRQQ